ncbi:MAG TPA: GAF domain-containing SpoIIE family protein phosphatase [Terriglobales bacterium]|nr:GAF domain-containing SpoIIE family protein phosphatase [Terriglobales bacterium]
METPSTASPTETGSAKDYIGAFANAVALFGTPAAGGDIFSHMPSLLVANFDAVRSELWLWDESSSSAYLTNAAGREGSHRRDFSTSGVGAIGKAVGSQKPLYNAPLVTAGDDDREFAIRTGLTHVSAYPLIARGRFIGVSANYTLQPVDKDLLQWWELCAQIGAASLQQVLTDRENQKTISQLALLFEATRLLNSTLDLAELLELILKIARTEVKADRGSVFLVDGKNRELWSIVAQGLDHQEIRLPFGRGVAGRVAVTGETINVQDAYELDYFERSFDQRTGYRTKSLLCLPIRHSAGHIVGVIQLLNQQTSGQFTKEDEEFLAKLSGHMAMALENARMHRDALEKQRSNRELEMARGIQRSLLPEAPPVIPGYDLAVASEPCADAGGDYYDFLTLGPQTMLLVLADVEGKGVASALAMSNLQASLRALVMHLHSLEVVMLSLNEMILNDSRSKKFLSIFLGLVDTRRNVLHFINAGHVPPLLINGQTGQSSKLASGGSAIGLLPGVEYAKGTAKLETSDVLVCCSDGVVDATSRQGETFGADRLGACVAAHREQRAESIIASVQKELNNFAAGGTHVDDKVLVVMKVTKERAE